MQFNKKKKYEQARGDKGMRYYPRQNVDSGYGEMMYMEPTENLISPTTDERDINYGVNEENMNQITPALRNRTIFQAIKKELSERVDTAQLVGESPISSLLVNLPSRQEERDRSPKTINVGDTKEEIEYNIRTLNARKSPNIQPYDTFTNSFERRGDRPQNATFEQNRYLDRSGKSLEASPEMNYYRPSRSPQYVDKRTFPEFRHAPGGTVQLDRSSPYQNYDEVNSSGEKYPDSVNNPQGNSRKFYGDPKSNETEIRNNRYINSTYVQPLRNQNYISGGSAPQRDDIQEKYYTRTYNNMTYRDVKRIVRRFTKVYDPQKNNNGLLVEESQITVPGASDDVFNSRFRVLSKMNKLSNILLSKQRQSPEKNIDVFSDDGGYYEGSGDEYNIKTFNRHSLEKRGKTPLNIPVNRSPEHKFKYVSLAMMSSKGVNTEDRIILRKMRLEKGGVVDLAQEDRKKGKFKIKKVKRNPGLRGLIRTNPKYRERAAKLIQEWWREIKELYNKRLKNIILIQSVYRGRFVRKYMYDLIYLNYLYLCFCQKIEKVLKNKIGPYVFEKLFGKKKNTNDVLKDVVLKADRRRQISLKPYWDKWVDLVRRYNKESYNTVNLLRIKADKNTLKGYVREAFYKWKYKSQMEHMKEKYVKETTVIEKTIDRVKVIKGEKDKEEDDTNKKKIETIEREKKETEDPNLKKQKEPEKEEDLIEKKNNLMNLKKIQKDNSDKLRGLFILLNGMNKYIKKEALDPTAPKVKDYLLNKIKNDKLRTICDKKPKYNKELLRKYFYRFLTNTLKVKNEQDKEEEEEREKEREKEREQERLDREKRDREREEEIERERELLRNKNKEAPKEDDEEKKKLDKENEEKRKKEILEMRNKLIKKIISTIIKRQNKDLLRKKFYIFYKKCMQDAREEDKLRLKQNLEKLKQKDDEIEKEKEKNKQIEKEREKEREKEKKKDIEREKEREQERLDREKRDREREEEENERKIREKLKGVKKDEKEEPTDVGNDLDRILLKKDILEKLIKYNKNKTVSDLINQKVGDNLKACGLMDNFVRRLTHKYPLEAFKDKITNNRTNDVLKDLLNIKEQVYKYLLQKALDKWRNKAKNKRNTERINQLFVKIIQITVNNIKKKLLNKKLHKWSKTTFQKPEEETKEPEPEVQKNKLDNLQSGKNIYDIGDLLKKIAVKKHGPEFLDKLKKMKNPDACSKALKKNIANLTKKQKDQLRKALNKWRNIVNKGDLKNLKTKLIYSLYNKNKKNNNKDLLNKYFQRWKDKVNNNKIANDLSTLKKDNTKVSRVVILKSIVRSVNKDNKLKNLKKYFDIWKNKVNGDKDKIDKLKNNVNNYNIKKNGPELVNNMKKIDNITKRKINLLKLIPKRDKKQKLLLYQYLLTWKNKMYALKASQAHLPYRNQVMSILLTKNDKENLIKGFNNWKNKSTQKLPKNPYSVANKILRHALIKRPFKKFVDILKKNDPKVLKPKGTKLKNGLDKIQNNRYKKFIDRLKLFIRTIKLKDVQPKVHDKLSKYLLNKYFNKWKDNTLGDKEKKTKLLISWIKRQYEKDKIKNDKRKNELLKRFILSITKDNKYKLKIPLLLWNRIAQMLKRSENASIIQKFCRNILKSINRKNQLKGEKLAKLLRAYARKKFLDQLKNFAKDNINDIKDVLKRNKDKNDKLRNLVNNKGKKDRLDLLRRAIQKWNEGKPLYDQKILIIQKSIRKLIAKKKLNNKKHLKNILLHLIKSNDDKDKSKLLSKLRQWSKICRKTKCVDNAKTIQDFVRQRLGKRLADKYKKFFNDLAKKYLKRLINNNAKLNKLRKVLRHKPLKEGFNKLKQNKKNDKIRIALLKIFGKKDNNVKDQLLRHYLNKWNKKVKQLKDKENENAKKIQTAFRGYIVRNKIKKNKDKINRLRNLVKKNDNNNNILRTNLAKWRRNVRKMDCVDNANIIQKFCRRILRAANDKLKHKNDENYKNLVRTLMKILSNPKDFFDRLRTLNRNKVLKKLGDDLVHKRLYNLRNANNKIKEWNKLKQLFLTMSIPDNLRKRILKKYLDKWKNNATNGQKLNNILQKLLNKKDKAGKDNLRATLTNWLYRAQKMKADKNADTIIKFIRDKLKKLLAKKNWHKLADALSGNKNNKNIKDIVKRIRILMGLKKLNKPLKSLAGKKVLDSLNRNKNVKIFIKKIRYLIDKKGNKTDKDRLKKYFDKWRDNVNKLKSRDDALKKMMDTLQKNNLKKDVSCLNNASLLKKLFDNILKIRALNCFNKLRGFGNQRGNYNHLSNNLLKAQDDLKQKNLTPLIKKLYKVYAYKVLDNLFNKLKKMQKKKLSPALEEFFNKLKDIYNKNRNYSYQAGQKKDCTPQTTKISFHTQKPNKFRSMGNTNRTPFTTLAPYLANYLNELIHNRKKDAYDKLKNDYINRKFGETFKKYVNYKEKPNKEEFMDDLKKLYDLYVNKGPSNVKLFKLLRKIIIKKLLIQTKLIGKESKLIYLIRLIILYKMMARDRWIRQIVRKWRFTTFVKVMAQKKMKLLYKNLHLSYLEMVNSVFGNEEEINPSVLKEFERYSVESGMFINEDPYATKESKFYKSVKRKYVFEPIDLPRRTQTFTKKIETEEEITQSYPVYMDNPEFDINDESKIYSKETQGRADDGDSKQASLKRKKEEEDSKQTSTATRQKTFKNASEAPNEDEK